MRFSFQLGKGDGENERDLIRGDLRERETERQTKRERDCLEGDHALIK